jgi:hypothetical protein
MKFNHNSVNAPKLDSLALRKTSENCSYILYATLEVARPSSADRLVLTKTRQLRGATSVWLDGVAPSEIYPSMRR